MPWHGDTHSCTFAFLCLEVNPREAFCVRNAVVCEGISFDGKWGNLIFYYQWCVLCGVLCIQMQQMVKWVSYMDLLSHHNCIVMQFELPFRVRGLCLLSSILVDKKCDTVWDRMRDWN